MIEAMGRGEKVEAPYRLSDLVADTVGLLDALGIEKTHVVGLSMGGMIAQLMAAGHPDRVLTLTSIMSTTGEPGLPASTPEAWACLTAPLETELEPFLRQYLLKWRVYGGPRYPIDPVAAQDHASRVFARGIHEAGRDRQLAAILASGSRKEALASVSCPALVIHGDSDPVVRIEEAWRPPTPSRAPSSSPSKAWDTTWQRGCGPRSSTRSPGTPDEGRRSGIHEPSATG